MSVYVTDTHPLIWFATGKHKELSRRALQAFNAASRGEALIYLPPFVLWEIAVLLKVGRIALRENFGDWTDSLAAHFEWFAAVPFAAPLNLRVRPTLPNEADIVWQKIIG